MAWSEKHSRKGGSTKREAALKVFFLFPFVLMGPRSHKRPFEGCDLDQRGDYGNSLLHYAAVAHQPESVKLLLELGMPVDIRTKAGRTPLHEAVGCVVIS